MSLKSCKRFIKRIGFSLASILPFGLLRSASGRDVLMLNYHSIQGWDVNEVIRTNNSYRTLDEFEMDILFLKKKYSFIDLPTFLSYAKRQATIPVNSVLLTFDDGLSVVYSQIRPILLKHKVPAVFFINPHFIDNKDLHYQRKKNLLHKSLKDNDLIGDFESASNLLKDAGISSKSISSGIDQISYRNRKVLNDLARCMSFSFDEYLTKNKIYLDSSQIKEMIEQGFYFGGHSLDHPDFNELSIQEQYEQTVGSIDEVCEMYKQKQRVFAFPRNDNKIKNEFFEMVAPHCEASFGVGGMIDDEVAFHWRRTDIESSQVKACSALKFYYCKAIVKQLFGFGIYKRK
ncbi:polysaccharide deacetylase family protein [Carboxylicivirga sp. N1Y90]|uniref:polysaccharide deacetylase family protein n=1 Tax=Carboxylicivirga fragile TaxID=3417571 RepID=UPI003D3460E0|nr:polysaccharide deacetylase family protein [Marinilabiliaceae bacterium N1Y90]